MIAQITYPRWTKFFLCTQYMAGNGGTAPIVLNLGMRRTDWSAMSLSLYSRGGKKSSRATDWTELGWAICRRQDNSDWSLAAQEAGGEYITARTSTGLKTGPQRLTVAIMDRIGPTRMAKARTPKDFFFFGCFSFYCIVLVGAGSPRPRACSLFRTPPHGRFIWHQRLGDPVTADRKPPVPNQ